MTLSYVFLFTVLVLGLGWLFREILQYQLHQNASAILDEEWAAVKGFLRVENHRPVWIYEKDDEEETFYVQRMKRIFLLADHDGQILEASPLYTNLGIESKEEIQAILKKKNSERTRWDSEGIPYLIRAGLLIDDGRKEFMLSIGRSLEADQKVVVEFTRNYFSIVPVLLLGIGFLGWWMAGRALKPLNAVAQTAASISGESLNLRIPKRGAGDELDHLIESFNGMVDRLQTSFNQVRQFSIDVSHELRTPLTAIRGQLDVAMFTARSAEDYRQAIESAIEDVEQMGNIVKSLLHLSQAEMGQVALAKDPLDLAAVVKGVVDQFDVPAELEGIELGAELNHHVTVQGDKTQLDRLVSNLLANAMKYTGKGGKVRVGVFPKGESVDLIVEDTGRGIAPEHLPHIFDRFYRAPDGNASPDRGLGLGLSFVQWIAKAHGAKIHVDSRPGAGTRFIVTFPVESEAAGIAEPAGDRIVA